MIKKSDFGPDKSIDQLIEEELENDGGPLRDVYARNSQRIESSRRAGMPGPPEWSLKLVQEVQRAELTAAEVQRHRDLADQKMKKEQQITFWGLMSGLMNLLVCCLVGLMVALVVLEMFK